MFRSIWLRVAVPIIVKVIKDAVEKLLDEKPPKPTPPPEEKPDPEPPEIPGAPLGR